MRRWGPLHPPVTTATVEEAVAEATAPLAAKTALAPFATKDDIAPLAPKAMLSDYAKAVALLDYAKTVDILPFIPPVFRFYAQPSLLVVGTVSLWALSANRAFRLKRLVVRLSSLTGGTLAGALKLNGVTIQTFSLTPSAKVAKYTGSNLTAMIAEDDYLQLVVTGAGVGQGEFTMTLETTLS